MMDLNKLREEAESGEGISGSRLFELLDYAQQLEKSESAAQKDAARYQWLRDNGIEKSFKLVQTGGVLMTVHSDATLDSAIDAAMASKA